MNYFRKFRGQGAALPPKAEFNELLFVWSGGFLAIAVVGFLTQSFGNLLVMGSFGASSVLLFGFPQSPFSQPRNVIAGHVFSTLIGLLFLHGLGGEWWSMALALATALVVMIATRTVHPPAGSNPLIVFLLGANWDYLLFPTLAGATVLVGVALFFNNLHRARSYPKYWV